MKTAIKTGVSIDVLRLIAENPNAKEDQKYAAVAEWVHLSLMQYNLLSLKDSLAPDKNSQKSMHVYEQGIGLVTEILRLGKLLTDPYHKANIYSSGLILFEQIHHKTEMSAFFKMTHPYLIFKINRAYLEYKKNLEEILISHGCPKSEMVQVAKQLHQAKQNRRRLSFISSKRV